jgi:hypothetical protein
MDRWLGDPVACDKDSTDYLRASVRQDVMLNMIKPLLALLFVSHVILAQQTPLVSPIHSGIQQLSSTTAEEHTVLSHAAFPKHRVRVTRVEGFCDTTVAYVLYR